MATKTIADLTKLRAELVDRRRQEAYWIDGPHHDMISGMIGAFTMNRGGHH